MVFGNDWQQFKKILNKFFLMFDPKMKIRKKKLNPYLITKIEEWAQTFLLSALKLFYNCITFFVSNGLMHYLVFP
jgi:hypothetical protein